MIVYENSSNKNENDVFFWVFGLFVRKKDINGQHNSNNNFCLSQKAVFFKVLFSTISKSYFFE